MGRKLVIAVGLLSAIALAAGSARAQEKKEKTHPAPQQHAAAGEPHPVVHYQRVAPPAGWNNRPQTADRTAYQHNYQAPRSFQIGPYHQPAGWSAHRWAYGQILPRAYWTAEYLIADYWLFGLEVPPVGYEWVRDGADAILVSLTTGEILQVEYSVFA
jgi:Ni/Co efflux regulator RcnB